MSKSESDKGTIYLLDPIELSKKKIMKALTDSENKFYYDPENKPGISNLIQIYASLKDISIEETENIFKDCHKYGEFKKAVADVVVDVLAPFQEKYKEVLASGKIDEILDEGAKRASYIANKTLLKVKKTVGLYVHK